ncbi:MAG: porin [Pseudomonadota bacterium]
MTLAKRLLLGSAAAVVATTGAQAADLGLPVAPAVDYVQICSIGSFTGFILPGSDVCFDISGLARFQANFGSGLDYTSNSPSFDSLWGRDDVDFVSEVELNFDARTMTEWGLLRGFVRLGADAEGEDYGLNVVKAFVQVGGFTAGLTDSFFDPVYTDYAGASLGGGFGPSDDLTLFGYSFAVGNGVTLSASIEDNDGNSRYAGIGFVDANGGLLTGTGAAVVLGTNGSGNFQDTENGFALVAAVRVDQAWGSAKVAGAITEVDVDNTLLTTNGPLPLAADDTEIGYAVQASAEFNIPVGMGSTFGLHAIYTDGALSYAGLGGVAVASTATTSIDLGMDAIISSTGALQTTQAYSLGAGFDIGLTNMISAQLDGYYADVDHGAAIGAVGDYNVMGLRGSITYVPVSGLSIIAGVGYTAYDFDNTTAVTTGLAASPTVVDTVDDIFEDDAFSARLRITRSF